MKKYLVALATLIFLACSLKGKKDVKEDKLPEGTVVLEIQPEKFIERLPGSLKENSGIIVYDKLLWTFNDSGGENKLFAFNFSGEIEMEVEIEDAKNDDWEDITQDEKYIYVGDFGNNRGNRNNQKIYRIEKKDIKSKKEQKVESDKIKFSYREQERFEFLPKTTPWDCEAMIAFEGNLYLFLKDWSQQTTTVYKLPAKKGEYEISGMDKFEINGLVTGADISPDKTKLALLGYKNYMPFSWIFTGFSANSFFSGNKFYISLNSIFDAQTEGICFKGNDSLLISCERSTTFIEQVFLLDIKSLK